MDFHCHLDLYPNARDVFAQAQERNEFTWLVTTSPRAFTATSRVLGGSDKVLITPGLHPEIVGGRHAELDMLLEQIRQVKAVGEVGLDGSKRFQASYDLQRSVFVAVVAQCAALGGRVLSIHSRQAVQDVRKRSINPTRYMKDGEIRYSSRAPAPLESLTRTTGQLAVGLAPAPPPSTRWICFY